METTTYSPALEMEKKSGKAFIIARLITSIYTLGNMHILCNQILSNSEHTIPLCNQDDYDRDPPPPLGSGTMVCDTSTKIGHLRAKWTQDGLQDYSRIP